MDRKHIKSKAKDSLKRNYKYGVLISLLICSFTVLYFLLEFPFTIRLNPLRAIQREQVNIIVSLSMFVLSLFVFNPIAVYCKNWYVKHGEFNIKDVFQKDKYFKILKITIIQFIRLFISILPVAIVFGILYSYTVTLFTSKQIGILTILVMMLLFTLGIGIYRWIKLIIKWSQTPYIIFSDQQYDAEKTIKFSESMMKEHEWEYFVLQLSFIGWSLFGIITLGIVKIFWKDPYLLETNAEYFKMLRKISRAIK